jgi:hypothetical protein
MVILQLLQNPLSEHPGIQISLHLFVARISVLPARNICSIICLSLFIPIFSPFIPFPPIKILLMLTTIFLYFPTTYHLVKLTIPSHNGHLHSFPYFCHVAHPMAAMCLAGLSLLPPFTSLSVNVGTNRKISTLLLSSQPIFLFFFSHLPTNSQHSLLSTIHFPLTKHSRH